jgi:hypothetical protein
MGLLLLLTSPSSAWSQVVVSLSPLPAKATKRILGRRAATVAMAWVGSVENNSAETIMVTEAAIIRRIPQLGPYDRATLGLVLAEAVKRSPWQIAGRLFQDLSLALAFGQASGLLRWGKVSAAIIAGLNSNGPYIVGRLDGADIPTQANFSALALDTVTLEPGRGAVIHVFTAPQDKPMPISFVIDTAALARVKVAR